MRITRVGAGWVNCPHAGKMLMANRHTVKESFSLDRFISDDLREQELQPGFSFDEVFEEEILAIKDGIREEINPVS